MSIRDSYIYQIATATGIGKPLLPTLQAQLTIAQGLHEVLPPREVGNTNLRVVINYINVRGRPLSFLMDVPHDAIDRFEIDRFVTGYAEAMGEPIEDLKDPTIDLGKFLFVLMGTSVTEMLNVIGEESPENRKIYNVSSQALGAMITCLLGDPLDVCLVCKEQAGGSVMINNLWSVTSRVVNAESPDGLKETSTVEITKNDFWTADGTVNRARVEEVLDTDDASATIYEGEPVVSKIISEGDYTLQDDDVYQVMPKPNDPSYLGEIWVERPDGTRRYTFVFSDIDIPLF